MIEDNVNCNETFIGLNNFDNDWKWTDETMFGYSHWNQDECLGFTFRLFHNSF